MKKISQHFLFLRDCVPRQNHFFCKMQVRYNIFLGVSCCLLLNRTCCFYCLGLLLLFVKCSILSIVTAKVVKIRTVEWRLLMQPLDVHFPLPLYSELSAWIALVKFFDQGSSSFHVSTISQHPPSHSNRYEVEIKYHPSLLMITASDNSVNIITRPLGITLSIPDI